MKNLQIQICLVSARGLRRTPSFWKLQWYAVAWIHPQHKFCTKIDATASGNPLWNTTFFITIDSSDANLRNSALHVEVYSREPVFLRESLFGSATVVLKEFFEKYESKSEYAAAAEEIGSFQLRKKKSDRAVGFVDVSIRISDEPQTTPYLAPEDGFVLRDQVDPTPPNPAGSLHPAQPHPLPPPYLHHFGGANHHPATTGASYQPPPPPPANVGYGSYYGPAPPADYISMPSSVGPSGHGPGPRPGLGMGVVAGGALAAGAMIYGEDLVSEFGVPSASWGSVVSAYPPF